jgi:iron complex transport system ATP-binding protein
MSSQKNGVSVEWRDVSVQQGGNQILAKVNLEVEAGSWCSLVGPNGAGKTTMIRALGGSVEHLGEVFLDGRPCTDYSVVERARLMAIVPQHPVIPHGVSVFDYVLLGRAPHSGVRAAASVEDRRVALALLQRLDLERFVKRSVESLSGGERQRVVLARALAQQAPVLVLDEPTASVDLGRQVEVLELVAELRNEVSLTVISTLHDLSIAGQFADTLAVVHDGRIALSGAPVDTLTPDVISKYWGVHADVAPDDDGSVIVTVRRRRSRVQSSTL